MLLLLSEYVSFNHWQRGDVLRWEIRSTHSIELISGHIKLLRIRDDSFFLYRTIF